MIDEECPALVQHCKFALTRKFTVLCLYCRSSYFVSSHPQLSNVIRFLNQGWATARSQRNTTVCIHDVKSREISNKTRYHSYLVSEDTVEVFRVDNILLVYLTRLWKITQVWRSSPIILRLSSIPVLYPQFPVTVGLVRPSSMPGVVMLVSLITNCVVY